MTKKIISLFAILLLLGAPTMIVAEETAQSGSTTEWLEDTVDFGTDSYDVDGCFC